MTTTKANLILIVYDAIHEVVLLSGDIDPAFLRTLALLSAPSSVSVPHSSDLY